MDDIALAPLFAFLNSHDLDDADEWLHPETFHAWVAEHAANGVLDIPDGARRALQGELRALAGDAAAVDAVELAVARDVRDGLLALLFEDGTGVPGELDRLVAELPLRLRVTEAGRVELEPATRGPLAIAARALLLAHDAAVDGTWDRISLCCGDDCHWAFVDRSKNHSRRWCSMDDCGARAKARAYRERRRVAD